MAGWPYTTQRWKRLRLSKLQEQPMCEHCKAIGLLVLASVVDHVQPIKHGGDPFPALDGLAALCPPSHSAKTARGIEAGAAKTTRQRNRRGCTASGLPIDPSHHWNGGNGRLSEETIERRMPSELKPSRIPLTIVCGPAGSGKSSYVHERAGSNDVVICLDTIIMKLTKLPEHHSQPWAVTKALDIRNMKLRRLADDVEHERAWFIISAPEPRERARWQARLGGDLVVLSTPLPECARRIKADPARAGLTERMIATATDWWAKNPHLKGKSLRAEPVATTANTSAQLVSGSGRADG